MIQTAKKIPVFLTNLFISAVEIESVNVRLFQYYANLINEG